MLPSKPLPLFIDNWKESTHIQHAIFILVWGKIYGNSKLTPSSAWTNYAFELVIYQFHTLTYGVWWSDLLWSLGNDTQWLKKKHILTSQKRNPSMIWDDSGCMNWYPWWWWLSSFQYPPTHIGVLLHKIWKLMKLANSFIHWFCTRSYFLL